MPYIYNIFWLSHKELEPMLRPTFLDHENDANTYAETDDYLFGKDLLIASVVEKGQRQREVYLPQNNAGWYDFYDQTYYQAGQTIYVGAPLERIPLFVKAGAVIPMSGRMAYSNPQADTIRELAIYPLKQSGEIQTSIYDDDGLTYGYKNGEYLQLNITLRSTQEAVYLDIQKQGHWKPAYQVIKLTLPTNETRQLIVNGTEFKKGTELSLAEIKEI